MIMEAKHNGMLVRQYHGKSKNITISKREGRTYYVQRVKVPGRSDDFAIICPSQYVSKTHCEIFRKDQAFWIRDCKSTNGTFLNGVRIKESCERELRFNDIIGLGVSHLEEDPSIDVKEGKYYIFKFQQVNEDLPSETHDKAAEKSPSSDEDIQVVFEVKAAGVPASSTNNNVPAKKSVPRIAPPPPIISKPLSPGLNDTAKSPPERAPERNKDEDAKLRGKNDHNANNNLLEKSNNADSCSKNNKFMKAGKSFDVIRTKNKLSSSNSSSDDSSDGLGDVEDPVQSPFNYPPRLAPDSGKRRSAYSGVSSSEYSSADEDQDSKGEKPGWKKIAPNVGEDRYQEDDSDADSAPESSCSDDDGTRVRERLMELKFIASHTYCFAKRKRVIYHDKTGSVRFSREAQEFSKGDEKLLLKLRRQYLKSLRKWKKSSSSSTPSTSKHTAQSEHKRRKSSSSESECSEKKALSEESSSNSNKLLPTVKPKRRRILDDSESSDAATEEQDQEFEPENMEIDEEEDARSPEDASLDRMDSEPTIENEKDTKITEFSPAPDRDKPKVQALQRRIQVIEYFPQPRFAVIAQSKHAAFKRPLPSTSSKSRAILSAADAGKPLDSNSSTVPLTKEDLKQARSDKLREIQLKKQQEKALEEENAPKKLKQPAKIKLTTRNRNQDLMESIVGEKFSDADSQVGEPPKVRPTVLPTKPPAFAPPPPPAVTPKLNPPAPSHPPAPVVKLTDPRLERRNNTVAQSSRFPQAPTPKAVAIAMPAKNSKSDRPGPASTKGSTGATMVKIGAEIQMSPPTALQPVSYREQRSKPVQREIRLKIKPYKEEDDIYKKMVNWIPAWIEEQKKEQLPPPVFSKEPLNCTVRTYQSFDVYFGTYYPLLLNEIWSTISSDVEKKQASVETGSSKRTTDYFIKIDSSNESSHCPLAKTKSVSEHNMWLVIRYHTWVRHIHEVDTKKDLIKLSIVGHEKGSSNTVERAKDLFAFSLFATESYHPVSKPGDCDPRLSPKEGKGGFKFCETIFCKVPSAFMIDITRLMKLERLCTISPKIREFKALNCMQSFRLFNHIVKPAPADDLKNSWGSNGNHISPDLLTICTKRLNFDQRSMVSYIGNRVFANEPELMLMHGPPGTGKTLTIVCLVLQLLSDSLKKRPTSTNRRILICTPSNAAVDEITRRLIEASKALPTTFNKGKPLNIVRVGEGYAKDLEPYSVNTKVKDRSEEKSAAVDIKVELTSINDEIKDLEGEIQGLKKIKGDDNLVKLQSKLSILSELVVKRGKYEGDLEAVTKKKQARESLEEKRMWVLREADVVCSTLSASSSSLIKNLATKIRSTSNERLFMCCIVDEASQTTEPESLLPLALDIDKLLLVGDPHQLGATVLSSLAEDKGYGTSLFTRLFEFYARKKGTGNSPIMMLKQQYRMHEEIVKWPNIYFYEDQLKTYYASRADYPLRPYYFFNLTSGREKSNAGQIENAKEVGLVKSLIEVIDGILIPSKKKWSVGVITPYSKQKSQLKKEFYNKTYDSFQSVEIDTVDGFQGQEKDIIILSCVRTEATGFLKCRNRLNVALTRAKHSLYIIGDANCLSKDQMWCCLIQNAAQRKCKYDVTSDFSTNSKVFQSVLKGKLTDK